MVNGRGYGSMMPGYFGGAAGARAPDDDGPGALAIVAVTCGAAALGGVLALLALHLRGRHKARRHRGSAKLWSPSRSRPSTAFAVTGR
jgi:hypothetical protein